MMVTTAMTKAAKRRAKEAKIKAAFALAVEVATGKALVLMI